MNYEDIKHVGSYPERRNIQYPAEMIFAEEWERVNKRRAGINHGFGILELILEDDSSHIHMTQRDAFVAASVIQWLGTNIGLAFVTKCERKVKKMLPKLKPAQIFVQRALKGQDKTGSGLVL